MAVVGVAGVSCPIRVVVSLLLLLVLLRARKYDFDYSTYVQHQGCNYILNSPVLYLQLFCDVSH